MIGEKLDGKYIIQDWIGSGGMADVYRAYEVNVDRNVAVKLMNENVAQDETSRKRFQREARAIANLEHMNILPLYAYGGHGDRLYLVMRYMPHGTLDDLIAELGQLPYNQISRILRQVAAALDYAHAAGIIHRDLKPSNILLDEDQNAFLADFGLAKQFSQPDRQNLTGQYVVGTPRYMSPEQVRGKELTPASDQYALGCVMYAMIAGRPPFEHEEHLGVMRMHLMEMVPAFAKFRDGVPEDAQDAVARALAKKPEDRYPNCSALAVAFERGLKDKSESRLDKSSIPNQLRNRIVSALSKVETDDDEDE